MYSSLKLLRIHPEETNLKSRFRCLLLFLDKNLFSFFAGLFFIGIGLFAIWIGYEWTWVTPLKVGRDTPLETKDWIIFWGFLSGFIIFFPLFGLWFLRDFFFDPILGWLLKPAKYEFVSGKITKSTYRPSTTRPGHKLDRMNIVVQAHHHDEKISVEESFAPWIWYFADPEQEKGLKKGDDWYSLKGKRPTLPIGAYLLVEKKTKGRATLVGIPAQDLDPAVKIIEKEQSVVSKLNWIFVCILIATLVIGTYLKTH